jgi:hypothetical protein
MKHRRERSRSRIRVGFIATAATVLVVGGAISAAALLPEAGATQTATCTHHPTLSPGFDGSSFQITCTVPNPPASTVTQTATQTATPTATATATQTATATVTATATQTATATATATSTATSTATPTSGTWLCTTSDRSGRCGIAWSDTSFCDYPDITGIKGGANGGCAYVDQNMWSPLQGETQTLRANSPGDWEIVSDTPVNSSGSVTTFPNVGAPFDEQPMSSFSSIVSSFDETMPHNSQTSGWAMYDNWFDDWKYEVMIQHDFTRNGPCTYDAVATFDGQLWGLCAFGDINGGAFAWKLAAPGSVKGSSGTRNISTGTIDIKAMTQWLVDHGYMDPAPNITNLSYGWEICSTGGTSETFRVNEYSLMAN